MGGNRLPPCHLERSRKISEHSDGQGGYYFNHNLPFSFVGGAFTPPDMFDYAQYDKRKRQTSQKPYGFYFTVQRATSLCDEQGILKTAQCAVLPCEVSERNRSRDAVTEAAAFLTAAENKSRKTSLWPNKAKQYAPKLKITPLTKRELVV